MINKTGQQGFDCCAASILMTTGQEEFLHARNEKSTALLD
jgi:hypothetical protein